MPPGMPAMPGSSHPRRRIAAGGGPKRLPLDARSMSGRIGIFVLWLLHFLPLPLLAVIGRGVGLLAYLFITKRRRIAATNLELCFPELSRVERTRLLRRHFQHFGRALVESSIAW